MNYFSVGLTLLALGLTASQAVAQDTSSDDALRPAHLINLDDADLLHKGQFAGSIDLRAFGGGEDLFYTSVGVRYGLGHHLEADLRASLADRTDLTLPAGAGAIRHGGNDVEFLARYRLLAAGAGALKPAVTAQVGVGLPSTPDRGAASLTLGLSASTTLARRIAFTLNPRAVVLKSSTLVGIGIGAQIRLVKGVSLVGDFTPLVSGDNTRNTATGALMRRDVYGAAFRFSAPDSPFSLDLGYTNGLGATTGFSLTPGLDGSGAFYFAITARR